MTGFRRLALVGLALLAGACGNDFVSSEVLTGTAVVTYQDPATDFGSYRTYAITNKLAIFTEVDGEPTYTFVAAPEVFAAIRANMANRGYELVAILDPENPPPFPPDADLSINPIALQGNRSAYYPCDWWDWWTWPGFGCRVAWEWVPYRVGTLLIPMADTRNPAAGSEPAFALVWAGAGYSVLTPSASVNTQIAVRAVNQAFAQSPYLTAK